jgi:hypothetical protein
MTWNEYAEAVAKFEATADKPHELRFAHAYLGFMSEIGELESACQTHDHPNIKEELGDQCFYVAIPSRMTRHEPDVSAKGHTTEYDAANLVKRWLFGGKHPSEAAINNVTDTMFINVLRAAQRYGIAMEDIYQANFDKLNKRLAGGTKTYAQTADEDQRDRAAEAKIMEGK